MRTMITASAAALALSSAVQAQDLLVQTADGPMELHIRYNGFFWGLRVMVAELNAVVDQDAYVFDGGFRTAGFANWISDTRLEAGGTGRLDEMGGLMPSTYFHQGYDGRKNRRIEMTYGPEDIDIMVDPPFGDWGDPPATPEERLEALDPLSAWMQVSVHDAEDPCDRRVPVFDSRLRYNLRFEPVGYEDRIRVRGYRGPAHHCLVYYEPVSGFDPEDIEEDADIYEMGIDIWLADLGPGVTPPVRIRGHYGAVRVSVEAKRVWFRPVSDDNERVHALAEVPQRG